MFFLQISSHPGVKHYINKLINTIKSQIEKDKVEIIAFVVMDQQLRPLEKFVFELEMKSGGLVSER